MPSPPTTHCSPTRVLVHLERTVDAPRERVFRAWTDPEHLGWFAHPADPSPAVVDLRPGGTWRVLMVERTDKSYWTGGVFREIDAPGRLRFAWGAPDGWPELDLDRLDDVPQVAIDLAATPDGGTTVDVRVELGAHLGPDAAQWWLDAGIADGWTQTLDRLAPGLRHLA